MPKADGAHLSDKVQMICSLLSSHFHLPLASLVFVGVVAKQYNINTRLASEKTTDSPNLIT